MRSLGTKSSSAYFALGGCLALRTDVLYITQGHMAIVAFISFVQELQSNVS
jgi:hypothetical protein